MSSFNQQQELKRGLEGDEETKKREERIGNSKQQLANHIPHGLIVEILSRLPVKSLLQFRCVCKSWCSLISDSHFVKTHLSRSTEDDDYKYYRLILGVDLDSGLEFCSLYSVLHEPSVTVSAFELDYPLHLKDPRYPVSIQGSCNGLLCIAIDRDIFIWNPSIRKSKRLPDSGLKMGPGFMVYGFGYDESIDDYKVVAGFCSTTLFITQVRVYTLRTNAWRRILDFPYGLPGDSKFANGALHWPLRFSTFGSDYPWVIVSLDLAKETYKEVPQPKYGDGVYGDSVYSDGDFNLRLGILRGCICVLCNYYGTHSDIWVMKEYGVKDSWTKLFSIPYFTDPMIFQYSVPLCISKNGEILLQFRSLVIYDLKESTFRYPSIHNFTSFDEVDTYVESLVSPSADNELQEYH